MDLIGRQIGNHVVKKEIGVGGMGAVYLCEHPLLGRHVAVKVLHEEYARDPSTVERFFNEAKAANAIHHPNIVDISDFGWLPAANGQAATVYLVMELLEGRSLAAAIPSLSIEGALHVTRQCCRALAAGHQRGIVHRDLKPENIFLVTRESDELFVKIVDFGIAKLMNPGEGARTQIGAILGTPSYMSPEQCEGLGKVDHRADIYSLGVVLYEMLTKRLPFHAENFAKLALAHMTQTATPPSRIDPRISPELDAIVLHALEKSPARRFQSMDELLAAIDDPAAHRAAREGRRGDELQKTMVAQAVPPPLPLEETLQHAAAQVQAAPPRSPRRASRTIAASVVAAAVIGGAAIAIFARAPAPVKRSASQTALAPPSTPPAPPIPAPVAKAEPPAAPPVAEPVIQTVALTIQSDPAGATVTRGGDRMGVTPFTIEVPRATSALELDITHEGFAPERRVFAPDAPRQLFIELRALPRDSDAAPKRTVRRVSSELKPL